MYMLMEFIAELRGLVHTRVNITKALKSGKNELRIEVSNTWANRLIGDHALPENKRITWTNALYRLEGKTIVTGRAIGAG